MDSLREAISPKLPNEIWSLIFAFLPLDDRKCLRLTCRQFYDSCNCARFQSTEEVIFSGNYNSLDAILSLSNTRRNVWNVTLIQVSVNDTIHPFFEKQGANVRSLTLRYDKNPDVFCFGPGFVKTAIEHCVGLCSLSIALIDASPSECVLTDLETLADNSVVRNDVTDLTLKLRSCKNLSNRKFLKIFNVFPRIKRLELHLVVEDRVFETFSSITADVTSDEVFSFSSVYDRVLALSGNLEKLVLKFGRANEKDYRPYRILGKLCEIEMKNLKEFYLHLNYEPPNSSVFSFLGSFKNITHFKCVELSYFGGSTEDTYTSMLIRLLNTIDTLRSLTLKSINNCIDSELFQAFVRSKLVHLRCEKCAVFGYDWKIESSTLENSVMPNYTLKHLYIGRNPPHWLMLLFSKYFRRLENLYFASVDKNVLQNTFEYQTNLCSLQLSNYQFSLDMSPDFISKKRVMFQKWLDEGGVTIKRELDHLICLSIEEDQYCLAHFIFSQFLFPKLEFLDINFRYEHNNFKKLFLAGMRKLSQLKCLWLCAHDLFTFTEWSTLLSGFTKLKFLALSDLSSQPLQDSEYRQLFSLAPSLRFLVHSSLSGEIEARFFYDVMTNTVVKLSEEHPDPLYLQYNAFMFF